MNRLGLSDLHFDIVRAVASGKTWVEAAKQIGNYSESYSKVLRSRLLQKPEVVNEIAAIKAEARKTAVYELTDAVAEVDRAIAFGYSKGNPMSVAKLIELKSKLFGLIRDRVEIKAEVIDLKSALEAATRRVLDIMPASYLPLPAKTEETQTSHSPVFNVFGE